jgi:ubiquinone/menaquinone biosynthesis C-methylase UbiE
VHDDRYEGGVVNTRDAVELISSAFSEPGSTWLELGAGEGTFTRALAELVGPRGRIYAVDREPSAVAALERWAATGVGNVIPVAADFAQSFKLPGLHAPMLHGLLFANSLHFVRNAEVVVARLAAWLKPGGRVVFIEYDRRSADRWVPFPIPIARLAKLAAGARLSNPRITATRPSVYGGDLYVAVAQAL